MNIYLIGGSADLQKHTVNVPPPVFRVAVHAQLRSSMFINLPPERPVLRTAIYRRCMQTQYGAIYEYSHEENA